MSVPICEFALCFRFHPCLRSPVWRMAAALLLHSSALALLAFTVTFDSGVEVPPHLLPAAAKSFGGPHCTFLTHINVWLQLLYFALASLADLAGSGGSAARLRDWLFAVAAFPLGLFVTVMYWAIYSVDRELISPSSLDCYYPCWLDHLFHSTGLPLQVLEALVVRHAYPPRRLGGALTSLLFLFYVLWLNTIHLLGSFWVYPFLEILSARVAKLVSLGKLST